MNMRSFFSQLSVFGCLLLVMLCATLSSCRSGTSSPGGISLQHSLQHYSYPPISFDSYLTVPDKTKFDVEKVRDMSRQAGIEILTILTSTDMNTTIQVARTKRNISFASLYEEKKSLADEISRAGMNVMQEQYTKLLVEKTQFFGTTEALSEHGEKANGEVAEAVEFLSGGYDYVFMFIYKNKSLADSDATGREKVMQSINIKSGQ